MKRIRRADWELLARYAAGECSPSEREELLAWASVDADRQRLLDEVQHAWSHARESERPFDAGAAWDDLDGRIRRRARVHPLAVRREVRPRRRAAGYVLRIAAVLAMIGLTTLLIRSLTDAGRPAPTAEASPSVHQTGRGERAVIRLSDGTTVRLNAQSELSVPRAFEGAARTVGLKGQAFFEVAHDAARPFRVETVRGEVQVLGTSFDVSAYPDGEPFRVAVVTGRVALRSAGADTVMLLARTLATVVDTLPPIIRKNAPLDGYLAWLSGRLEFHDAPFGEVVAQLSRWYDLDIEVDVAPREVMKLNATFKDEPLGEILNSISTVLDVRYERTNRTIRFFR